MIVVDASALIEMLFGSPVGKRVLRTIRQNRAALLAPELLQVETLQVLRRVVRAKELSLSRAEEALQDFRDMPIKFFPHVSLVNRIWELKGNFTAYDAAYIALAEQLKAKLLTTDSAIANASGKLHQAKILPV